MSLSEVLESSSLSKKFFNILLNREFVKFLDIGTKFNPLLRTDFSASESERFSGMETTVLRLSSDESTREELNQFITAINSFHPALKYTWEISDTSLAFLDIKLSIEGNGLCTSVHYKPTDSHSYLLYSSLHPSHVKNSILYSQLLRLRRQAL